MSRKALTPQDLGVGMRLSIHPHAGNTQQIISDSVQETHRLVVVGEPGSGLEVVSDEVSTYVGVTSGDAAQQLAHYALTLIYTAALASNRQYLAVHLLLSRGAPDEMPDDLTVDDLPREKTVFLPTLGLPASANWSLYSLSDGGIPHMDPINAAITEAQDSGLTVKSDHFVTKLSGELSVILSVILDTWAKTAEQVPHVVTHATISVDPFKF